MDYGIAVYKQDDVIYAPMFTGDTISVDTPLGEKILSILDDLSSKTTVGESCKYDIKYSIGYDGPWEHNALVDWLLAQKKENISMSLQFDEFWEG